MENETITMTEKNTMRLVEAALFMAGRPMSIRELSESLGTQRKNVVDSINDLISDYAGRGSALEVFLGREGEVAGMRVRDEYLSHVRGLSTLTDVSDGEKKTLALVAFYQPIRQSEVVKIRGNRAYRQLRNLEGAGLVRAEPKGATKMLATTQKFTEYFGGRGLEEIKESLKKPPPVAAAVAAAEKPAAEGEEQK